MKWAPLREDLTLLPGPRLRDGQPSWTLHDPARNLFFRLDWLSFEILRRWSLADPAAIAQAVASETTLKPLPEDIEALAHFLTRHQLVAPDHLSTTFASRARTERPSFGSRLLRHYLFFRVPLLKPDSWLDRWAGRLDFLYSRRFLQLTLAALVLGLIEIYRDWAHFSATLVDTLTWQGLAGYGATLVAVKVLHELGHAFTAKRYGCHVPTMGIAFLVMWPVAYTDTNDVWRLISRQQRLAVAVAGVATEIGVAAWATLAWGLLPDGQPRSIAFMLATSVWLTSIALNASPFMRFDGYYFLADWLDMPNLHARAFALARWDLRERMFALGEPVPENLPPGRLRALILFAWATWIYRLLLFVGIAALVYHFFLKALGIFLFSVEIGWFVLRPLGAELKAWHARWPALRRNRRSRLTAACAVGLLAIFAIPWPTRITEAGLLRPARVFPIHAMGAAQVVALPWANGASVATGDRLITLASPDIVRRWQKARARMETGRQLAANAHVDSAQRSRLRALEEDSVTAVAELASIEADMAPYMPAAPFPGRWMLLDPDLRLGTWVSRNDRLAVLVEDGRWIVETYLDEEAVQRVSVGDGGLFINEGLGGSAMPLVVTAIDRDATRQLSDGLLASSAGGSIATRLQRGLYLPERPVYRISLEVVGAPDGLQGHTWRGRVIIRGAWQAPGERFLRAALALLWREMGF